MRKKLKIYRKNEKELEIVLKNSIEIIKGYPNKCNEKIKIKKFIDKLKKRLYNNEK